MEKLEFETLQEACERCAKEAATLPAWMKGGPNYRVVEGEEIAMSDESKYQELPPLDVNLEDLEMSRKQDKLREHICRDALLLSIYCRERQLRDALAQIAALTAQAEDLSRDKGHLHIMAARNLERAEKAEAELAAMREGAKVHWRLEKSDPSVRDSWITCAASSSLENVVMAAKNVRPKSRPRRIVEVTTRERILDTTGETK